MTRILLVEDDKLTQSLLKSYLEKESFKVEVAGNGEEMSRLIERLDFSLIMLDLGLPDEDGLV
ncbi:MAG TPA: response regulator, partial [Rhodospirillales bacterium]|nr:response regulator [Rhodospirillales bacterium]